MPIRLRAKRGRRGKVIARGADATAALSGTAQSIAPIAGRIQSVVYDLTASIAGRYMASSLVSGTLSAKIADITAKIGDWAPAAAADVEFVPEPGFAVTSSTGKFTDGATLTITGTGFGAMNGDVIFYTRGEGGTHGQAIGGTPALVGGNLQTYTTSGAAPIVGTHYRYSSENVRPGRTISMRRTHEDDAGTYHAGGFGKSGFSETQLFITYNRFDTIPVFSPSTLNTNYKHFYVFGTAGPSGIDPQLMLFAPSDSNKYGFYNNNDNSAPTYNERNNINTAGWTVQNTRGRWVRWDVWAVRNTPGTVYPNADGVIQVWRDGQLGINNPRWWASNVGSNTYQMMWLGYMDREMPGSKFDYTDFYIANTRARVEITDQPSWDSAVASKREIQLTRAADWADTSIKTTCNVGAFSSLIDKCLYVVRSDGTTQKVGRFVEAAAPLNTNVSLSWTAPVSGDTSIAYYRVEWGTTHNGGWGTFINSQRVAAPTTKLDLLLPPRSYAFRIVTVATDGEESVPVLIGTKMVLADSSSARPSSLLPEIPAWIADTTVGLQAPHDLSMAGQTVVTDYPTYSANPVINITSADLVNGRYTILTRNRLYRLQTDIVSNDWCIGIGCGNITLDLNGHTLVYLNANKTLTNGPAPAYQDDTTACGIRIDKRLDTDGTTNMSGTIEIVNGYIVQGAGTATGMQGYSGVYACPIRSHETNLTTSQTGIIRYRGLYMQWHEKYSSAIAHYHSDPDVVVEYCTFKDDGNMVYNRQFQQAVVNVAESGVASEVRYCRIISGRQCGITAKTVHHNDIWVDDWWTQGAGVLAPQTSGVQIYSNNIYITGTHPQGVFVRDTVNCSIYDNWIESKYTRQGELLPSPTGGIDTVQNFATGLTFRFGDDSGLKFYANTTLGWAQNDSVPHPTDPTNPSNPVRDAEARSLFYFKYPSGTLSNNQIYENLMIVISEDEVARAFNLGLSGQASGLVIHDNHLVSNHTHFWIHDEYGPAEYGLFGNPPPIIRDNLVERLGSNTNYKTIRHGTPSGGPTNTAEATVTIQSNDWKNGSWPVSTAHITANHHITYVDEPGSVS
jgi:hypothetical protein